MNASRIGILLIIIGGISLTFGGFTLITNKKVVDLGEVEITHRERTPIYWSPILGISLILVGVVVVASAKKK